MPDLDALLAEADALCEAATEGPWTAVSHCSNPNAPGGVEPFDSKQTAGLGFEVEGPPYPVLDRYRFENGMDAVFVARARTLIPELCEALRRLREEKG